MRSEPPKDVLLTECGTPEENIKLQSSNSTLIRGDASTSQITILQQHSMGARTHYVMASRIQWKPFWLAT